MGGRMSLDEQLKANKRLISAILPHFGLTRGSASDSRIGP